MASRFPYIFVMATTDNKDKKDSFYALFKEILETQNKILANQEYIKSSLDRMQGEKPKQSVSDLWGNI